MRKYKNIKGCHNGCSYQDGFCPCGFYKKLEHIKLFAEATRYGLAYLALNNKSSHDKLKSLLDINLQ